jgi:hypothetical protein
LVELEFFPIVIDPVSLSCCRDLPGPAELGAINPYASPDVSWLDKYPEEYHDVLREFGMAPGTSPLYAESNDRVMEIADWDEPGVGSSVDRLYKEMFGDRPDDDDDDGR